MVNYFIIKLFTSFVVGGSVIALLGYLAERADKKIAGLVISLPSTVVISYIFIGWTLSPQAVSSAVPATIISACAVQVFAIVYYYLSKLKIGDRMSSMIYSISGALISWFIMAIPIAVVQFANIYLALLVYALFALSAYYFQKFKNTSQGTFQLIRYTAMQKLGRAIFAGLIITTAVLLANTLNPFWGGIFASFPAVFTSTFIILHYYHGHEMIAKVTKTIPTGSIVYVAFAFAARYTFPALGIILGTLAAYSASLVLFLILFRREKMIFS